MIQIKKTSASRPLPAVPVEDRPVVILIHGIRACGLWQTEIEATLRGQGVEVHLTHYEYFDLPRFLAPVSFYRRDIIEKVKAQVRRIVRDSAPRRVSVIAHSFGTYVFAHILRECPELSFNRVIFCGSIVPESFCFKDERARFNGPLVNEIGARDVWPAIAEAVTFGYGASGTHGVRKPWVRDRVHHGLDHSDFLNAGFCRQYWLPLLRDGAFVEVAPARSPSWVGLFSLVNIRTVLLALALWFFAPQARAYWAF